MDDAPRAQLAATIRRHRKDAGLSQEALAHAADLHPNAVGLLERGERDPLFSTLLAISRALTATTGAPVRVADLIAEIE